MGSKLRLAAPLLAVVALMLIGATASIAANGNGNGNGQGNGNGNNQGQGNGNSQGQGNSQGNGNGNGNSQGNDQGNGNSQGDGQGQGNNQGQGQDNGNRNDQGAASTPVTICHNPDMDATTLVVDDNAVQAHLSHGDYLGACDVSPADDEDGGSQDEEQTPDGDEDNGSVPTPLVFPTRPSSWTPGESRSLYCSTKGPVDRGNGEQPGVALNLTETQGALLVEKGLVTPAIYYAGLGVTCDVLAGFVYAGYWVDHVGDVVPGVAVYPYYIPNAG